MGRALPIAVLVAVALAGCGDDPPTTTKPAGQTIPADMPTATTSDDPQPAGSSGRGQDAERNDSQASERRPLGVRATLTLAFTKGPCALATDEFLSRAYGGRAGCTSAADAGGVANSVEIGKVEVDGDTATAVAVPAGGPSDGETIHVRLVRMGAWLIDDLKSNVPAGP